MTKNEFIQEAALRLTTAWASTAASFKSEDVAIAAKRIADDLWKPIEEEHSEAFELLTAFPDNEPIQTVAKEIARLEKEQADKKNAGYKEKGWFCHYQKSGADVRFLNLCRDTRRGHKQILTVADLLEEGCLAFNRRYGVGQTLTDYIGKALDNLYNIKTW